MADMDTRSDRSKPGVDTLDDSMLRAMAGHGQVRSYPANAVLVTEDDRSDALYIILKGRVRAYGSAEDGREVVYATQGPGEYFGELTLDGGPRSASVMTMEPTTVVVVPGAEVRDFLAHHPDFAVHLVRKLIGLVRTVTQQTKSLALDDVYGRVTRLLRTLAQELPGEPGVRQLPERLTQQDIADRVGASREMVSRVFKPLLEGGYVQMREGRIVLLKKLPARW
jgi:CRP/FNR family transcriptional regulator, cyclic AMP receptor protein